MTSHRYQVLGWQEWVVFPDWKSIRMKAKIDTGARSSAIHAAEYNVISPIPPTSRPTELRMKLKVGSPNKLKFIWVTAPLLEYRNVKNSGGRIEKRPFIQTRIEVAEQTYDIILSVTNREQMRYPILLGRAFLSGRFLVDSAARNLLM